MLLWEAFAVASRLRFIVIFLMMKNFSETYVTEECLLQTRL